MSAIRRAIVEATKPFWESYRQLSGYRKYGLLRHDLLLDNNFVMEAVRRLPAEQLEARNRRINRAMHLNMKNEILPKEEWTKPEEDLDYLAPYMFEVIREHQERTTFRDHL
eukprot:CAMPEP_0177642650 /NCGR_PEP_ID=MMETSP0447-20121125/7704_1 /TAXON_ID=0 /ORGANISM="Stygamoeba regulata, Strain BSH-02190019" /LENGTH=110 /DNA_ID=CAMNT_0019144831 /DNA_START=23 /DNA_END=355 /DNA_ORIENTATION=-